MLANKPLKSIIILITTNLAILVLTRLVSLLIPLINPFLNDIIQIIIKFILSLLLVFLIVPFVYKLPRKYDSFKDYLRGIHLNFQPSYSKIILYTISCYIIFLISELIGSLIYGHYVFDFSRAFPPQSYSLLDINMALFEEIMFRGIVFTLLLAHFSEQRSLYFSAVLFGIVHYANLLSEFNYEIFIFTTAQVIWAFGMGLLWGYLVLKTNSIIPGIILHYLSNAFDSLWFYIPTSSIELKIIYMLIFGKFIPIILSVLLINYISKLKSTASNI